MQNRKNTVENTWKKRVNELVDAVDETAYGDLVPILKLVDSKFDVNY